MATITPVTMSLPSKFGKPLQNLPQIVSKIFPKSNFTKPTSLTTRSLAKFLEHPINQRDLAQSFNNTIQHCKRTPVPLLSVSLPFFLVPEDALAINGEFGLLEGRTVSLVHPIVMGSLFVYSLWAGYLGWQWRRVRTTQNEINELKKQVKSPPQDSQGAATATATLTVSPVETKIQELTEERKQLLKGSYRERHYNAGSILLGFGVFESVGGCLNTWFRTGKLFPGPHLFAGAAITVLWAMAAALVPPMQKGSETARNLHITLNALNLILFASQIPTGIDIGFKVLEFTNWP
ncbi:uncharacterized protein LOC18438893 [Amborella trichopoda]|uniref:uncharacterized protein LOC18438893 n=1 Tax=Amborella trichopoda TaxID=13333 RepID=UPI0005D3E4B0|nr:uncharacterized protein LOC18438893 [Amborella trichopoda]|eukprot:XP_011625156.1 uncharacterized protein LOC18438893 [Amborella trichopoda]